MHIPFCRHACTYCDFHFSTSLRLAPDVVAAIESELINRAHEASGWSEVSTIYFGGGTPGYLPPGDIARLLEAIGKNFRVSSRCEITLEVNPEDVSHKALSQWMGAGVNRLSMGIQSFETPILQWMNRAHTGQDALRALAQSQDAGLTNISADLIYGIPNTNEHYFSQQLQRLVETGVPHISAYCLTLENRTALHQQVKSGKTALPSDERTSAEFLQTRAQLRQAGFEPYEVSNAAKPGMHSRHNSAYWSGSPYLGIGPSAHSYKGFTRRWNVANNARYVAAIKQGNAYWEEEVLTETMRFNEAVMTGLRRTQPLNLLALAEKYNLSLTREQKSVIDELFENEMATGSLEGLSLTDKGLLRCDGIAADLFILGPNAHNY